MAGNEKGTATEAQTPAATEKKRDSWDRVGLIAGWFGALIIPVVLGVLGYYLNLTLKNREGQTKMIELAIGILNAAPRSTPQDVALRNWAIDVIEKYSDVEFPAPAREQLESAPLDVLTGNPAGSATTPELQELNRLKNRELAPGASEIDKHVTLGALLAPGNDLHRFDQSPAATITGFVVKAKMGGPTSATFRSTRPEYRDILLHMAATASAPEKQQVIAVVTPRMRAQWRSAGDEWTLESLKGLEGHRAEVSGLLLFNTSHTRDAENTNPGGAHIWRATAWELHPVTAIRILDSSAPTHAK